MKFSGFTRYLTGILVPVSALRSSSSIGVGEFADLPALAEWCSRVGLDLIQLLPVNDTGWQPSPYSALTAFGLHPIYLRITDLPEYETLSPALREQTDAQLARIRGSYDTDSRIRYGALRDAKLAVIRGIYEAHCADGELDPEIAAEVRLFMDRNEWVAGYAAFKTLKARHDGAPWTAWSELRDPAPELLSQFLDAPENRLDVLYHAWLQLRLDEQFLDAARQVADLNVTLKGDLPILINEDSADAWLHRNYFSSRLRAGAPPDGENPLGQNWGLPTYDWQELASDDYSWWRSRLEQAGRYYSAYRIDHVLGFFRVWSIPATDVSGYLGYYVPGASADRNRLHDSGLDDGRIRWLAEPHIRGEWIENDLGEEGDEVAELALEQIEDQNLFVISRSIRGERDITSLDLSDEAKGWLLQQYRDRALVRLPQDRFVPAWTFGACSRFRDLPDDQKSPLERIERELASESENAWEEQGRTILSMMRETTDMLPCAEDLGAIPDCVPGVLQELRILGLRIPRWARRWQQDGQPYIPVSEYPFLSVCAPSVHDTSTMRGWWYEVEDRQPFWESLGLPGSAPPDYDADTARLVVEALLETSSALCVLQYQDMLALAPDRDPGSPEDERVNVPGTMSDFNWGYRMPQPISELAANRELEAVLAPLLQDRRKRPMSGL